MAKQQSKSKKSKVVLKTSKFSSNQFLKASKFSGGNKGGAYGNMPTVRFHTQHKGGS